MRVRRPDSPGALGQVSILHFPGAQHLHAWGSNTPVLLGTPGLAKGGQADVISPDGSSHRVRDEAAPEYDRHRRGDPVYSSCIDVATRAISKRRGGIVLDAGCGTGLTTLPLLPYFKTIVAL